MHDKPFTTSCGIAQDAPADSIAASSLYRTIVADPPWPISWSGGGRTRVNGRGERHTNNRFREGLTYSTMTVDAIAALDVPGLAAENAHLFLWTTDVHLLSGEAARVVAAWGFERPRLLVWRKTGFGLGTFPRPQHEQCIVAIRGSLAFGRRDVGSVQTWKLVYERGRNSAARKHSGKPEGFFDLVREVSPGPYLELFARTRRLGWDSWGNEVDCDVELAS